MSAQRGPSGTWPPPDREGGPSSVPRFADGAPSAPSFSGGQLLASQPAPSLGPFSQPVPTQPVPTQPVPTQPSAAPTGVPSLPTGTVIRSPRGYEYAVESLLGAGQFGAVYACRGPFDEAFAIKAFGPGQRPYAQVREDWLREANRLYRLRHPNIVYVHDYFEAEDLFFLVLERCDHGLEEMLGTPFTDRLVIEVSRQLLFALQYLADMDVIHNDLHAGNVLAVQGDRLTVKLGDLGIALELYGQRAVRPSIVHHRIMAPEVIGSGYSTKQSDLYQLGLLMYAMHTGRYPIDFSASADEVLRQIRDGVPRARAEALGTPVGNVISVMLRRHEQYRYTSPAQVWNDLRRL